MRVASQYLSPASGIIGSKSKQRGIGRRHGTYHGGICRMSAGPAQDLTNSAIASTVLGWQAIEGIRKQFFFEKKNQKTFTLYGI
jgi:hypothetical protein